MNLLFKAFLLCTLTGFAYFMAFPEWNFTALVWVALVPWLFFLEMELPIRWTLVGTAWTSLLIGIGGFHWVAYSMQQFGGVPRWVGLTGLILFSVTCQLQLYAYAWIRRKNQELSCVTGIPSILAYALLYAGLDWFLPKLFCDTLGHAFLPFQRLVQSADLGGAYLLTFAAVAVNETIIYSWKEIRLSHKMQAGAAMSLTLAVVAGLWGYGGTRLEQIHLQLSKPERLVPISIIQANIGDIEKVASESGSGSASDKVVDSYLGLTRQALDEDPKTEITLWPETAYPSTFLTPNSPSDFQRHQRVIQMVNERRATLLFGGYDRQGRKDFNSLFLMSPSSLNVYHKNILLPFGEYIPIVGDIPWVEKRLPQVGNFGRGPGAQTFPVRLSDGAYLFVGPVICYEALVPSYTRGAARQGNQLILNITNDSWFGPHGEPYLHLLLTSFRSIETRLPQIRATNTGISTLILPDGRWVNPSPLNQALPLHYRVPILQSDRYRGLYYNWGEWFAPTALLSSLAVFGWCFFRRRRASLKA